MIGRIGRGRGLRAGERFGRISPTPAIVARDGFATDTRLGFNATVAPPELEKGKYLLRFRHLQVIGHRHPSRDEPLRMSETAYPKWPVFRRSCVAAFQRSLTRSTSLLTTADTLAHAIQQLGWAHPDDVASSQGARQEHWACMHW